MIRIVLLLLLATTFSCGHTFAPDTTPSLPTSAADPAPKEFDDYWYSGQAEITTYALDQARYGDSHPGEVVMIFVTEDFLLDAQVKKENETTAPATSVLKLNRIDRFTTGIYDYSTMLSTFSPVAYREYGGPLKTTYSSQDWCGQSWMQVNRRDNGYRAEMRSYFQAEGDRDVDLENAVLEDGLWAQIRLDPNALPQGGFEIIPSSQHIRFRHTDVGPEKANGRLSLEVDDQDGERFIYSLVYESGRELKVFIQTVFPYRILGWEERSKSGFGSSAKMLTTRATLKSSLNAPYWSKNSPKDQELRKMLGLD